MTTKYSCSLCYAALVCCLCLFGCKKESDPSTSQFKRYPFKNIHLSYEYVGSARGTEDFYVADYGKYEARYSHMQQITPAGIRPYENAGITKISDVYSIDYIDKKVVHLRMSSLDSLYRLPESEIPTPEEFLEATMKDNYFIQSGTDNILGHKTTVWTQQDETLKLWVWSSMPMKRFTVIEDGTLGTNVVSIDTNWVVDTMKFHIPTDFEFVEQQPKK